MWGSNVTRERLLQKISLLAMLGPIREGTKENELVSRSAVGHSLTIEQEAEIVSNLAFLSYRRKDPKVVTSICIEEDENGQGMTIRVAVNGSVISHIEKGLRQICTILERVSLCGRVLETLFVYFC